MDKLLEERKELFRDRVLIDGFMVLTNAAKKRLHEIDREVRRLRMDKEVINEIEDRFAHVGEEIILDMSDRFNKLADKVDSRIGDLEPYLKVMVELLGKLVEGR